MFFSQIGFFYGVVMSLEGLRRGQTGSALMAAFVCMEAENYPNMAIHFEHIELMCEIGELILDRVPPFLEFIVSPFIDYIAGCRCFVTVVEEVIKDIPVPYENYTCTPWWPRPPSES